MPFSVHRLDMARVNLQGQYNPPDFLDTRIGVYAYLVLAGSNIILVDTGVGTGNAHIEATFAPTTTSIIDELARFEIAASEVGVVANTHLHFDHCGNNRLFRNAKILVQNRELEVARETNYTVRNWFDYDAAQLVPVDGDLEVCPGVKLLFTPGHTPGHQSVLVESPTDRLLIAAQAAYTADEYQRGGDPGTQAHRGLEREYVQSIERLKDLGADEVYFSHDSLAVYAGECTTNR